MLSQEIKEVVLQHWRAALPVVALDALSGDERRVVQSVAQVVDAYGELFPGSIKIPTFVFDQADRLRVVETHPEGDILMSPSGWEPESDLILDFLEFVRQYDSPAVFICLDLHKMLGSGGDKPDIVVTRALRNTSADLRTSHKRLVLIGENLDFTEELDASLHVVKVGYPTDRDMLEFIKAQVASMNAYSEVRDGFEVDLPEVDLSRLVRAAQGLSLTEVYDFLRLFASMEGRLDASVVEFVSHKKLQKLVRSGCEFCASPNVEIAGLENLKDWLRVRGTLFHRQHQNSKLPPPKGVLLVGPPGTGKTLVAKTIGKFWGVPVLSLSMDKILGSLVGESETNIKRILGFATANKPCILFVDELDKALGGANELDGGVGKRVLGILLTWMAENEGVFVVATANDVSALPPELLRRGRFSGIFYVGLPNEEERSAILTVHLERFECSSDLSPSEFQELVKLTAGFSGAEIAAVVEDGVTESSLPGSASVAQAIIAAAKATKPISVNVKVPEAVLAIATPASKPVVQKTNGKARHNKIEMV